MRTRQVRGGVALAFILSSIVFWFPLTADAQTAGRIPQYNPAGPPPATVDSALDQATVVSSSDITSDASIFIKGPGPWIDVTRYGAVANSTTDDATAINNAINACPPSTAAMTSAGCTIFFPYSGTGNYLIKSSIKVNTSSTLQDGIRLVGECTPLGAGSTRTGGGPATPLTCSTIIANGTFTSSDAMLVVGGFVTGGGTAVKTHGFVLQDLGFSDTSSNGNVVPGAIHLIELEDFSLVNPRCESFGASSPNGYCMEFDGGGDFTQFGVVMNPSVERVRYPVLTNGGTSEVNFYGGELDCTGPSADAIMGSIGFNLGATYNPPTGKTNGEWGIYGTHVLNCATGLSGYQANVLQWYGIAEIPTPTASTSGTIGVYLTGSGSGGNGGGSTIAGSINNYETCVQLALTATSAPPDVRILASLTPNMTNGVALNIDSSVIGKTLVLTPENYSGAGGTVSGTASGSAFGSDVVVSSDVNPRALLTTIPNGSSGATQTAVMKLAKLSGGTAVITATTDTQGALGIVVNGAGTSGSAQIATVGQALCAFDGATVAGDFATISQTTGGDCHDYAASLSPNGFYPPTGQILGRVLSTNASGGNYPVSVVGPGQVAPAPQVRNSVTLTDDFFAAGTTNGTIGELGWAFTAGNIAKLVGQANHPGILQRTSTSNTVLAQTWLGHDNNATQAIASLSGVAFRAAFIIKIENNPATTTIRMGFADDASAAPPNNGIYFENTTGTWTGIARSSSMSSTTSSSTTADNMFHTFQIVNDGANNISFWDNDTLLGTVTSNVPGVALLPFFDIQSNNASSKSMDIDAFQFTMTVSR